MLENLYRDHWRKMNMILSRVGLYMKQQDYSTQLTLEKPNKPIDPMFSAYGKITPISDLIPLVGTKPWTWQLSFSDFWGVGIHFDKNYMHAAIQVRYDRQLYLDDIETITEHYTDAQLLRTRSLALDCFLRDIKTFVKFYQKAFLFLKDHDMISRIYIESDDHTSDITSQCIFYKELSGSAKQKYDQLLSMATRKQYINYALELVSYAEHHRIMPQSRFDIKQFIGKYGTYMKQ